MDGWEIVRDFFEKSVYLSSHWSIYESIFSFDFSIHKSNVQGSDKLWQVVFELPRPVVTSHLSMIYQILQAFYQPLTEPCFIEMKICLSSDHAMDQLW